MGEGERDGEEEWGRERGMERKSGGGREGWRGRVGEGERDGEEGRGRERGMERKSGGWRRRDGEEGRGRESRTSTTSSILTFYIKYTSGFVLERNTTRFVTSAALVSGSLWSSWVLSSQLIILPILSRKSSVTG